MALESGHEDYYFEGRKLRFHRSRLLAIPCVDCARYLSGRFFPGRYLSVGGSRGVDRGSGAGGNFDCVAGWARADGWGARDDREYFGAVGERTPLEAGGWRLADGTEFGSPSVLQHGPCRRGARDRDARVDCYAARLLGISLGRGGYEFAALERGNLCGAIVLR